MRFMIPMVGAIAFVTATASAGYTLDSYTQQVFGTIRDTAQPPGTPYPVYHETDVTTGGTTTMNRTLDSTNHFSGISDWGSAEVIFGGSNTSSVSGSTYSFSGASSVSFDGVQTDWAIRAGVSNELVVTLDSTTTLSMAVAWTLQSETVVGGGGMSGGWSVLAADSNGIPTDPANPVNQMGSNLASDSLNGTVTLAAGTYRIGLSGYQERTGFATDDVSFSYSASIAFSDGGGGAVPGLGALAPLAAAGLARRRRR